MGSGLSPVRAGHQPHQFVNQQAANAEPLRREEAEFVNGHEAAEMLEVPLRVARRFVRDGKLPAQRRKGNRLRYHRNDVERLIGSPELREQGGSYLPTPEQIAAACAEIQAGWTPAERYARKRGILPYGDQSPPAGQCNRRSPF